MADDIPTLDEDGYRFTVEAAGELVEVNLDDLSGKEMRDFKRVVDKSPHPAFSSLINEGADPEFIAGFLWVIRKRDTPNLNFENVLGSLTGKEIRSIKFPAVEKLVRQMQGLDEEDDEGEAPARAKGGRSSNGSRTSQNATASDRGKSKS